MYGIRDNKQWIGFNKRLTNSVRQAMKFETFEEARQNTPPFFCAVKLPEDKKNERE